MAPRPEAARKSIINDDFSKRKVDLRASQPLEITPHSVPEPKVETNTFVRRSADPLFVSLPDVVEDVSDHVGHFSEEVHEIHPFDQVLPPASGLLQSIGVDLTVNDRQLAVRGSVLTGPENAQREARSLISELARQQGVANDASELLIEKRHAEPELIDLGDTVNQALKDVFKDLEEVTELESDVYHYE